MGKILNRTGLMGFYGENPGWAAGMGELVRE